MALENKLGITNSAELAREEERISKKKAVELFESGALDKLAPGTANYDTLLYGVEVKFYNMEVAVDDHLQSRYPGLYVIGDGSGITHSLSHASASGVFVAHDILAQNAG